MNAVRRTVLALLIALLVLLVGYAAGLANRDGVLPWEASEAAAEAAGPAPETSSAVPAPPAEETRQPKVQPGTRVEPAPEATSEPEPRPTTGSEPAAEPEPEPEPELRPGPRLLGHGDWGDEVRDLQARLRQIRWFNHDVTGFYGDVTTTAVRGFQAKRGFPATGEVDQRTLDRLHEMSHAPTRAELTNQPPAGSTGDDGAAPLDPRCTTGRAICIDKTSSTLRWVIDGKVKLTVDARFGASATPTREGLFHVGRKDRDHVSNLYGSAMPYSMFFSRGQAIHYSSDFAARGYNGASHGCVNIRDRDAIAWLFDQVRIGERVVVYWSH